MAEKRDFFLVGQEQERPPRQAPSHRPPHCAMASTINIASFYREHIRHGVRPNGRKLNRARSVVADAGSAVSTADGSALIRMGSTAVLASVQCEPIAPHLDDAEPQGRIVVSIDMPAICSAAASAGQGGSAASAAGAAGRSGKRERDKAVLAELLQNTAIAQMVDFRFAFS